MTNPHTPETSRTTGAPRKIEVLVVDDSAVVRGLITRILESDPAIQVIGSAQNGEVAVNSFSKLAPDVVVMDIEMPVMDGLTALPKLLAVSPDAKVIICSTLSAKNATTTVRALELGASDCVLKPSSSSEISSGENFQRQLLSLVKSLGQAGLRKRPEKSGPGAIMQTVRARSEAAPPAPKAASFTLHSSRLDYAGVPSIVAIGSSTGGPQALFEVTKHLKGINAPIVITQHMPPTFTAILAQHISQHSGMAAHEGAEGMPVQPGQIYVAPGGKHMEIVDVAGRMEVRLNDGPPENFCKPSVEPMFRSVFALHGQKMLAVMLTGMGSDGLQSSKTLVEGHARLIAQDEQSSVVWGMPGAVARAGLCTAVLPLTQIGPWIRKSFMLSPLI